MSKYNNITDFHASRAKRVGASEIPTLAGVNPYQTAVDLWAIKTGKEEGFTGNEASAWGHHLEPIILTQWAKKTHPEKKEEITNMHLAHITGNLELANGGPFHILTEAINEDYPFAIAHADLIYDDGEEKYIVQAKSHSLYASMRKENIDSGYSDDDFTENGIPATVFLQEQWEMFCYGIDTAFVAVLMDTNKHRIYGPIHKNVKIQEQCLALAANFIECVENNIPPQPVSKEDIDKLFPKTSGKTRMLSGDDLLTVMAAIAEKKDLDVKIKELKKKKKDCENAIYLAAMENDVIASPEGEQLAKISATKSLTGPSLKTLEKDHKEIYDYIVENGLIKESNSRRMYL